jgi:hypothetical protein
LEIIRWRGEIPITLLIAGDAETTTIKGASDVAEVRSWLDAQKAVGTPAR